MCTHAARRAPACVPQREPHSSYRRVVACTSVYFAGLFEDVDAQGGNGARSDATGPFAVCAAGSEPSGLRRLPVPVPAAFHSLLPYLNTGDEARAGSVRRK